MNPEPIKENIKDIAIDTTNIYNLRPVSFIWKLGGKEDIGLLKEDLDDIFPFLNERDDEGTIYRIRYELLSVILLKEIQKLRIELDELKGASTNGS